MWETLTAVLDLLERETEGLILGMRFVASGELENLLTGPNP